MGAKESSIDMELTKLHYASANSTLHTVTIVCVFLGEIQTPNLDLTPALKRTMMLMASVSASAKKKTRVLLTRYVFQKLNLTHSNRTRFAGGNSIRFLCGWAEQGIRTKNNEVISIQSFHWLISLWFRHRNFLLSFH